ncbi:fimbrial protein [Citrobacter sp. BDA59-3]|uniref:fimbrial protein n=1 Tax=Citrobacter sp. BDA59-3 TaxID=2781952 RepID=UPI00187E1E77|nr:type 1 fimbrial protein [Citrobacter sp. BDA59-3]QOV68613.1 type 1 fimbrial protein [Citrobacter sp. BDA59-3]
MIQGTIKFKSALLILFLSQSAMAFNFNQSSATAYMNASSFPNTLGDITSLASGAASVTANGWPNPISKDHVKIESVTLDSALIDREFTIEVKVANSSWMSNTAAINKCVWVDGSCSTNGSTSTAVNNRATQPVFIRLKRNTLNSYDAIPNGANIATVKLQQYGGGGSVRGAAAYLYFKFDGAVTPVVPTCDVKNFDNNVTLPKVKRTDLVSHGSGRYTGATKEFNINLACENTPKVNVTFSGDKMSGVASEDVLVNKLSGNDNVGVQILYGSNPLKIGEKVAVLSAAGSNELLKFNAYYYYKGGTVQGGTIKSQSEFTFTYE